MGIGPHGFSTEKKPRYLYFMVDNLLHSISKLQCLYFHVGITLSAGKRGFGRFQEVIIFERGF